MGDIQLSILVMTPGNNPYLEQCLKSFDSLRKAIPSELIVVDTGCNTMDRKLVDCYADRVVEFSWCDDFAAARNAGLEVCCGEWLLYLDDDEYLVDVAALVAFFGSDDVKDTVYATFPLRNYMDDTLRDYRKGAVSRLYRMDGDTRFIYRIHEAIPVVEGAKNKWIETPIGHYGYIFHTEEERNAHAMRNVCLLEAALAEEERGNLHLASQLAHEYQIIDDYEKQIATCERYYPLAEQAPVERAILVCGWFAGLIGTQKYETVLSNVEELAAGNLSFQSVQATLYAYAVISAYRMERYEAVLRYLNLYREYYDAMKNNPDALSLEFFTRNGGEEGYHSLVLQMGMISAFHLSQEVEMLRLARTIAWSDEQMQLCDDLPKILCEIVESDSYSPEMAVFLEEVLSEPIVRNAVLCYRLGTIQV